MQHNTDGRLDKLIQEFIHNIIYKNNYILGVKAK